MEKGLITMPNHNENFDKAMAKLHDMGIETTWEKEKIRSSKDPQVVIPFVKDCDYVFAGGEIWNKEVFDACPNLKLLVRLGVGHDAIDLKAATEAGVPVTFMPGVNAGSVAELAVTLMLTVSRGVAAMNSRIHAGNRPAAIFTTHSLTGKTVGIMGCGKIGKNVAKLVQAFGCKVLAYDVYPDPEFAAQYRVTYVDTETLLKESDIISLHLPLLPETKHFVNAESIAKMKDGVIIINTSRGGTVDSKALSDAIRSGKVAGAGLDVVEDEDGGNKSAGEVFYDLDNVVLTPHVGGVSFECLEELMEHGVEMVQQLKNGEPVKWLLNPEVFNK